LDLRDKTTLEYVFERFRHIDEVYQLAADMGGAGYVFTGEHDADIMTNSMLINLNVAQIICNKKIKLFYSSSACVYPQQLQDNCAIVKRLAEDLAHPANPDSEYGWEKLFSEHLYKSYERNFALDIRIARFHNIFGEEGTYQGGKEKAPAAVCRKVSKAKNGESIDIWGDGFQIRSFLYIDECIEGIRRLMQSDCKQIVNIGSEEIVSINELADMVIKISNKNLKINHIKGPQGVRGRCSNNDLIKKELGWQPTQSLINGLEVTYKWIDSQW
jgi:GDP-D-mannose 3', 5'-epimerase